MIDWQTYTEGDSDRKLTVAYIYGYTIRIKPNKAYNKFKVEIDKPDSGDWPGEYDTDKLGSFASLQAAKEGARREILGTLRDIIRELE